MKNNKHTKSKTITVDYLTQLSLNTRFTSVRLLDDLHPAVNACLLPIVLGTSQCIPTLSEFAVEMEFGQRDSVRFLISKSGVEVVVGALVWGSQEEAVTWAWLSELFDMFVAPYAAWDLGPPPCKPGQMPWLGTILLPTIGNLTPEEAKLIGGCGSSLSLAILQYLRSQN